MRLLSFRRATAFSFFLHVAFVLFAAAFAIRGPVQSPVSYTVRLVSAEAPEPSPKSVRPAEKAPQKKPAAEAVAPKEKTAPQKEAPPRDDSAELMKHKAETLQALREKQAALYKKERIGELRSRVESEQAAEPQGPSSPSAPATEGERLKILDDYIFEIERNIREHWVFPDIDITGLEAVISITVLKNGFIRINRFERPSGNQLYDRSALKAITRAGRVEPPPFGEDLDIGIRFRPDEP